MLQAGNNRQELEKVLKYYGKNPADSLKLRAAEFLILHMPGKYSVYYDAPWNDVATVMLRWTSSSKKQLVLDTYQLGDQIRTDDITHITGDYLINNIELAFKVWKEMPWGKNITFDVFCEEILPYRAGIEPLENWREKVMACLDDLYQLFKEDSAITVVEACCRVNDRLPRFRIDKDFPPMSFSQNIASTRGTCNNMVSLAVFAMRGLGIPVTCDFTNHQFGFPDIQTGHWWNSVNDCSGSYHSFMGAESNPVDFQSIKYFFKAKVYRDRYANQKNVIANEEDIPSFIRNINHMLDVTSQYDLCLDISIPVLNHPLNQTRYAFLSILHNSQWQAVGWGIVDGVQKWIRSD